MVKKLLSFLALGWLLASVLVACGTGGTPAHTALGTEVHMNSANFVQAEITIQKGQSVTLINDDPLTPHIIANGTWENGAAKPAKEPNVPEVNKKIEPSLRSECNVFDRTDSIYQRLVYCCYSGARKGLAFSTTQED